MDEITDRLVLANIVINFAVSFVLIIMGFLETFDSPSKGWIMIGVGLWLLFNLWSMSQLGNENEK